MLFPSWIVAAGSVIIVGMVSVTANAIPAKTGNIHFLSDIQRYYQENS
jgi:hypothetical protein